MVYSSEQTQIEITGRATVHRAGVQEAGQRAPSGGAGQLCRAPSLSRLWLFATQWTVAYQAARSTGFFRQEHWNGLPVWTVLTPSQQWCVTTCLEYCQPQKLIKPGCPGFLCRSQWYRHGRPHQRLRVGSLPLQRGQADTIARAKRPPLSLHTWCC